tara:strand:- start:3183 stop:7127 length:3945 start_codon:yes stop_codon:yes gene_type:complete
MKNKRIIYWGGNDHTIIPRMGACGEGVEVEPAEGAGPQKPAGSASAPDSPGLFDKLKGLLPALALGALALAAVAGVAFMLKKNREGDGDLDGLDFDPTLSDAENFAKLGLDIQGARTANRSANMGQNGFDDNGLPTPPDFVGQQIIDEDGNLWIYKDPPGAWINFGDETPRYSSGGDIDVPIYAPYVGNIIEVKSNSEVVLDKTWDDASAEAGNLKNYENLYESWRVEYPKEKDLYTFLQFDDDKESLAINFLKDTTNYEEYPNSLVYKLYEPLPDGIGKGDLTYVVKEMAAPYTETVQLVDFVEEDIDGVLLRNPKWDSGTQQESYFSPRDTKFKTYDELVSTDTTVKEAVENEIISGSFMESIELTGIDYRQWENFIHFSSIEDRLKNFKTKLQKIELFESQSKSLTGISGSLTYSHTASLDQKVRKTKNQFTPFENYMYFKSSSYFSSSLGEFYENAWPKNGGSGTTLDPYTLYPVTSSEATTWYNNQITSASLYDRQNRNRLLDNIPDHVVNDGRNVAFHTFINMMGEHFDNIHSYIKEIPQIYDRRQPLDEGISKELIYAVGRSLGFYLNDGQDLISLPKLVLGQEATGSDANVFSTHSTKAQKDISREIWKRMINNMPFFLKTRGTLRSFKGLINCYGIPSTILRVKEYGGPDPAPDTQPSYFVDRNFTKALDFKSGRYVLTTWANDTNSGRKPDTIEMRFRADSGSNQTLVQGGTDWALTLQDNGSSDNYGTVKFEAGAFSLSSNSLPIYDGEFYSVMLTRMSASIGDAGKHYSGSSAGQLTADTTSQNILYSLYVKKYDSGTQRIIYHSFTSGSTSTTAHNAAFVGDETAYIGGKSSNDFGNQLSGSIMEFRYWNTALNSGSFDNHVAAPKSFDGNHASASWTDLVLRYSFDDDKDLSSDGDIRDTSADQSYIQSGSAQSFSSATTPHFRSVVDEEQMRIPNVGPSRRVSNKVRLEESKLIYGNLAVNKRVELSAYDTAPLDSNKLGIFFSPADVINEDIIRSVANLDFDQYIGDPRDQYKLRYRQLEDVGNTYWQKYNEPNNFWDYIRLIRYYDSSLFEQLRSFVPARARANVGLLIEPNILERKKEVVGKLPDFDDLYSEGTADAWVNYSMSGIYPPLEASMSAFVTNITGSYPTYVGSGSLFEYLATSGSYTTYEGTVTSSFWDPSLYQLSSSVNIEYGHKVYDITTGGPTHVFEEALQPTITGSRLSEHNFEYRFFYTSSRDALKDHGYVWDSERRNFHSSSFVRSDKVSVGYDNAFFRLAYGGCIQTKKTTSDGGLPVEVTVTSPTTLVTQEPGESKLKVK